MIGRWGAVWEPQEIDPADPLYIPEWSDPFRNDPDRTTRKES